MTKKILFIILILVITIILFVPWGEYQSNLEKNTLTNTIGTSDDENSPPSLEELEGLYSTSSETNKTAEILFLTEGLKDTKGGFDKFEINFNIGDDFKKSSLEVVIETSSLNTGNAMRDEHLAKEDFFNTSKYPQITYSSSSISLKNHIYIAQGNLNLNGTIKPLEVPFRHLGNGIQNNIPFEAFEGEFTFDRTAYGQEESSGVGNEVTVTFYCELEKQD